MEWTAVQDADERGRAVVVLRVPDVVSAGRERAAATLIRSYFGLEPRSAPLTGAFFNRIGGGGDQSTIADEITAEDLVAVTMLSVQVPASAALKILNNQRDQISLLLRKIPTDVELVDVPVEHITPDWPPWQLSRLLRQHAGVGAVISSKLLARKRPRLVPVFDAVVARQYGLRDDTGFWAALATALRAENRALWCRLIDIRNEAAVADISTLRVLDIATWMSGRRAHAPRPDA